MSDDFDPFKDLSKLDEEEPLEKEKREHFDPFASVDKPEKASPQRPSAKEGSEFIVPKPNPVPEDLGAPIDTQESSSAISTAATAETRTPEFADEPLIADLPMTPEGAEEETTEHTPAAPHAETQAAYTADVTPPPPLAEETPPASQAPQQSENADAGGTATEEPDDIPEMFDDDMRNYIQKGESVDITELDKTLREIRIGVGWDQRAVEEQMADIDLSVFLLKTNDQTNLDEDFVFYNNPQDLNEAVKHLGDSRTGAGEGDDEQVDIQLTSLSYETARVALVLSVYDDEMKGYTFDLAKNIFIRILNKENMEEIIRFNIPEEDLAGKRAMYMASILREGPQWIFEAESNAVEGTLADVATEHGILVKELQSTG